MDADRKFIKDNNILTKINAVKRTDYQTSLDFKKICSLIETQMNIQKIKQTKIFTQIKDEIPKNYIIMKGHDE